MKLNRNRTRMEQKIREDLIVHNNLTLYGKHKHDSEQLSSKGSYGGVQIFRFTVTFHLLFDFEAYKHWSDLFPLQAWTKSLVCLPHVSTVQWVLPY